MIRARVERWSVEEGWGVLESAAVPGGIFVHFSAIEGTGFKILAPGEDVEADVEGPLTYDQDGFRYMAVRVRRLG